MDRTPCSKFFKAKKKISSFINSINLFKKIYTLVSCCIVLKYVEMKKGVIAMKRKSSYNGKGDKERLPEGKKKSYEWL